MKPYIIAMFTISFPYVFSKFKIEKVSYGILMIIFGYGMCTIDVLLK